MGSDTSGTTESYKTAFTYTSAFDVTDKQKAQGVFK